MSKLSSSKSTYHSKVYLAFIEIESNDFQQIMRYYEENEEEIRALEFDEFFELLVAYVNALFESGHYEKHLVSVDVVIENSILRNIQYFKGEDIYRKMLFKKAASLYNLHQYDKADYVLRELIKIDPFEKDSIQFLKKCLRKGKSGLIRVTRAAAIFFFLLTAAIIAFEILSVRPFHNTYTRYVEAGRIGTFIFGLLVLLGGQLVHRWRIEKEVNDFAESIKKQKLTNQ